MICFGVAMTKYRRQNNLQRVYLVHSSEKFKSMVPGSALGRGSGGVAGSCGRAWGGGRQRQTERQRERQTFFIITHHHGIESSPAQMQEL